MFHIQCLSCFGAFQFWTPESGAWGVHVCLFRPLLLPFIAEYLKHVKCKLWLMPYAFLLRKIASQQDAVSMAMRILWISLENVECSVPRNALAFEQMYFSRVARTTPEPVGSALSIAPPHASIRPRI